MGPQPNSCGNGDITSQWLRELWLQWGHSQTAVETPVLKLLPERDIRFNGATAKQLWKLTVSAVRPALTTSGFNGATAKQLWKRVGEYLAGAGNLLGLQWGHSQTAVETEFP